MCTGAPSGNSQTSPGLASSHVSVLKFFHPLMQRSVTARNSSRRCDRHGSRRIAALTEQEGH